jgi:hypothetical protein
VLRFKKGDLRVVTAIAAVSFGATYVTSNAAMAWSSPTPHAEQATAAPLRPGRSPAGNLEVKVPPIPDRRHLRRICTDLLLHHDNSIEAYRGSSSDLRALIAATGGTRASAVTWCQNYLHPKRGRRP